MYNKVEGLKQAYLVHNICEKVSSPYFIMALVCCKVILKLPLIYDNDY